MPISLTEVILGVVVPAAISLALYYAARRWLPDELGQRYGAAVAFAVAYCVAFVLLHSWAYWIPQRHWHWTFYLAAGAAAIGPICASAGLRWFERGVLVLAACSISAWLLVPNYRDLQSVRHILALCLGAYLVVLWALLEPLAGRLSARVFLASLTVSALCVGVLIAAAVSVTYGKTACIAAGGMAGCAAAALLPSKSTAVVGLSLSYAVIVGGWGFIGYVEPRTPLVGLLIAPAAPLALWCCVWGPLGRLRGLAAVAVQAAAVAVVLGVAVALTMTAVR
jgi:hypothetical protein